MFEILVYLGVGASAVGVYSYIRGTLRGEVKPNRVSWLMWSLAPLIASAAAISDGVRLAVVPVFLSGAGPLLIFLASFVSRKAYWRLQRFDWINGALSLIALLLWAVTKDPNVAILFAIVSDAFAAVPTLVKIWNFPKTEIRWPYVTALFSALTSFGVIKTWHFSSYAFAAYLVIIDTLLILAFSRKRPRTEIKKLEARVG